MFTILRRKLKRKISKKIIFQNDIYEINLDRKKFEVMGIPSGYRKKLFKQSFFNLCMLFQTDKAPFQHLVGPSFNEKKIIRVIRQTHDYAKYYDKFFCSNRFRIKNICEIGVGAGSSTAAFYYYFPNSMIFTLDNNYQRFNIFSKRIKKYQVDQSNKKSLRDFKKKFKYEKFDIIIDDGSHLDKDIVLTFNELIPHLKNKGHYIIEDVSYELTPNIMKLLKNKKYLKEKKIKTIKVFKSEEAFELLKVDGTKQNYIVFLKKQ